MTSSPEPKPDRIALTGALMLGVCALIVLAWRYDAPAPAPLDAPAHDASAARAEPVLRALIGDGTPRPAGSKALERSREALHAELNALGVEPVIQRASVCGRRYERCGDVVNTLARLSAPGDARDAVLLSAHLDSVARAPGAGDNGAAAAALVEVLRAVKASPEPLRHDLIVLWEDAEETGLLGAEAFAREHAWARDVRVAINLDARGTSGPSMMFETSPGDRALVERFAAHARRPVSNSLMATVYRALPNDTDFSIWRDAGFLGLNFAFIGDPLHYHTPLDDLDHLDRGSLQHHSTNALDAVRAFNAGPLPEAPSPDDAIFFDVLAWRLVVLPGWAAWLIWGLALLGVLAAAARLVRDGDTSGRGLAWGALAAPVACLTAAALGVAAWAALGGLSFPRPPWSPQPLWARAAFWSFGALGVCAASALLRTRGGRWGVWVSAALACALLTALTLVGAPGASYPLLVMLAAAGVVGVGVAARGAGSPWALRGAVWLPWAGALVTVGPLLPLLDEGLGQPAQPVMALAAGLASVCVAPALVTLERASLARVAALLGLIAAAGGVGAWVVGP